MIGLDFMIYDLELPGFDQDSTRSKRHLRGSKFIAK